MKPHPSIFEAALKLAGVAARESVMVGDSLAHDIEGARRVGMRGDAGAALARRSGAADAGQDVPVDSRTCHELTPQLPLARRPGQPASGEQVQMDVEHRLPGFAVAVEHRAVAAVA